MLHAELIQRATKAEAIARRLVASDPDRTPRFETCQMIVGPEDQMCQHAPIPGKPWCQAHHAETVIPDSNAQLRRTIRHAERIADAFNIRTTKPHVAFGTGARSAAAAVTLERMTAGEIGAVRVAPLVAERER